MQNQDTDPNKAQSQKPEGAEPQKTAADQGGGGGGVTAKDIEELMEKHKEATSKVASLKGDVERLTEDLAKSRKEAGEQKARADAALDSLRDSEAKVAELKGDSSKRAALQEERGKLAESAVEGIRRACMLDPGADPGAVAQQIADSHNAALEVLGKVASLAYAPQMGSASSERDLTPSDSLDPLSRICLEG